MADREGDPAKKPESCGARDGGDWTCPNLQETSSKSDFEGETYACAICGERFRLYYEDMA